MKRLVSLVASMALMASVFALKIPTGDNVRAADVKQNGDAIVEVTLGTATTNITTPIGVLQAKAGSVVYFYDTGALKELTSVEQNVTTPIGVVKAKDDTPIIFYENGVLSTLNPANGGFIEDREIEQKIDLPPLKAVKLSASRDMTFYESGKLKRVYLSGLGQTLETPIGTFVINRRASNEESPSFIEYYESGSPKVMYAKVDAPITVKGVEYGSFGWYNNWSTFYYYPKFFYDSGSSDRWILKSFVTGVYKKDGTDIVSTTYENALGKFEIAFNPSAEKSMIEFDKEGNVLSAKLYKSPDATVKVMGQDMFIKGGKYIQTNWDKWGHKNKKEAFCGISFYDSGEIKSCVLDELLVTEIDGIKLTIPAGEEIELWENGNIKRCYSSNPIKLKVKTTEYDIDAGNLLFFHRNGKLRAAETLFGLIDTFYSDGTPKRGIHYLDTYAPDEEVGYVWKFYTPKRYSECIVWDDNVGYNGYFQKGDLGRNVSMVFFDDNDNPSSYTMFKLDRKGNYILDNEGIPIEDPAKKKFVKQY